MSIIQICLILSVLVSIMLLFGLLFILQQRKRTRQELDLTVTQLHDKSEEAECFSSELKQLRNEFNLNVLHDSLTGLPSRQLLEDRLVQLVQQSKRNRLLFGVLFLDIDGFKVINDALGYDVGDELLRQFSARLMSSLRQVDTVCRFSGDEFLLLLPQITKSETCAYIAQRLLDSISQPFTVEGNDLFITACIGIAVFPADSDDGKVLLKYADNALHQAKMRGCNVYQFYREEMHVLSQRELELNLSLRNASIYHEFSLYYQPEVNTQTKEITCMEALLRWQHPHFGLVTPGEFLRLAENSGKIVEIGEYVLRTVCQQFQKWKQMNMRVNKVSVNISLRQLENPHFIYKISQILKETNMSVESLVFEISEGVFHKVDLLEKSLHMLKNMGIQIAVDDFGTGHLSLHQLKRISIDYLKIDSTFIQDITTNPDSEAIVKMVIALAQTLHLGIIAEGVETREQKDVLEGLGCHVMYGHYFSIPRKPEDFTPSLEQLIGNGE